MVQIQVVQYQTVEGKAPFQDWLHSIKDFVTRARIRTRVDRLELGNFGDCKSVGEGVSELRLHFGSGYRVYFGQEGPTLVILLCGGDKDSQSRDIKHAQEFWRDYKRRSK